MADITVPMATPAMAASALDPLAQLPIELLLRITRHLSTTDLCAVRLTSRTLERALFHSFSHEFFRRKQFMLSDFSLGALLGIAQHPALSQTLRHVSIGLETFSANNISANSVPDTTIAVHAAVAAQQSLVATGRGVRLLAAALALLPNLETVDLRDFSSHTRFRDGPYAPWSSYGMPTAVEQLGANQRQVPGLNPSFVTTAFSIVVAALAEARARPRRLEVMVRTRGMGLGGSALYLAAADADATLRVLAGLTRLHLDLMLLPSVSWQPFNQHNVHGFALQPAAAAGLPLHAWLAHCPAVEWLRINLQHADALAGDMILSALGMPLPRAYPFVASPADLPPASPDNTLPCAARLRRFELGHTACKPATLLALLRRLPALESLSLWHVALQDHDNTDRPSTIWSRFLAQLAVDPLAAQLKRVSLGSLREEARPIRMIASYDVAFGIQPSVEFTAEATDAKSMRIWLAKCSADAKTDEPDEDEDENSEDEEEEEDDQEEDDQEDEGGDDGDGNGDGFGPNGDTDMAS